MVLLICATERESATALLVATSNGRDFQQAD
jgi:hypothetical protein